MSDTSDITQKDDFSQNETKDVTQKTQKKIINLATYRYRAVVYQIPIQNCHTVSKTGAIENKTCLCFHSLCKTFFEYHERL